MSFDDEVLRLTGEFGSEQVAQQLVERDPPAGAFLHPRARPLVRTVAGHNRTG